jgi:hypothetical protein
MPTEKEKVIFETPDCNVANELWNSKEWRMPIYDAHRSIYVMIKKARK